MTLPETPLRRRCGATRWRVRGASPASRFATILLGILGACTAPPDTATADSGPADSGSPEADPPALCDSLDVIEVAALNEAELPTRADPSHTVQGVAIGDVDGDGWLDAIVAYAGGSFGMRNDGAGLLIMDDAMGEGGAPLPPAVAASMADLDGDGDLDAVLSGFNTETELLWNDGSGQFTREPIPNTAGATHANALGDADGDGDLDLFLSAANVDMTYEEIANGTQVGDPNLLLLQDADSHFSVTTDALPADTLYGMTLHTAWLDSEGDGDLDLYVANDAGPYLDPNHLLLNDGHARFTEAPACSCELAIFSMGAAVGDANQDGLPDLYVTDVAGPDLLINLGNNEFAEAALAMGAAIPALEESMVSWGTAFVDLDADTDQDLAVTFGKSGQNFTDSEMGVIDGEEQPDQILLSDGQAGYSRAAVPGFSDPSRTRTVAVGDLDRDGRPDLITVGKYFYRQWKTTGGCEPGATLQLIGRNAIGARVETTVDGATSTSWNLPSTTSASSAEEVYVGFGNAARAERIVVTWPGGAETLLEDVEPGSVLRLVQP